MLDDPGETLAAAASFLGLETDAATMARVFETTTRAYSKDPGMPYSRAARDRELDECRQRCAGEIERGIAWARRLVARSPRAAALAEYLPEA